MAFTPTAVLIAIIVATILIITGVIVLFVTRNKPQNRKWGWLTIVLGICAIISAIVNKNGIL
ncbi:DUF308 domain-containing protein [Alkalihalobacillus pseudalcaliphilus]|uniref:DUF308 domain-containing protein n=1 Tax=Alkalihalobacillus pseudalcaliphilus TaxID=79884 RepID=UPI00064DD6BD|nr:DUF308 domain-containing protein [Alkalihalobacillus pseudalcaliphilus]KMK74428.1 hypothetical protein AB990_21205 [Alkalihalobacillus pseudalcaliphilus]